MSLRRVFSTAGWSLLTFGFVSVLNTYRFVTVRHSLSLPGLKRPLRVAHLSDLHYGLFVGLGTIRRWVDATLHAKPDLIVITGDFLDSGFNVRSHPRLMAELGRLRAPLGVYAVWGNHDWTSLNTNRTRIRFAELLRVHGVRLINNAGLQVRDDLYLAGVDDWWFGMQDLDKALEGHEDGAVMLLAHNPDYLPHVPERVGLTLSGHTHGGQVRLPLLGPLKKRMTLSTIMQGWVRGTEIITSPAEGTPSVTPDGEALGFVSRGLGVTGVPVRLNCPAELVLLDLSPPGERTQE
ncbi:metallophosphoesterase [Deinococcus peraridilitoris]|uniref:Putative phosphohydrolase n=1 Tax=Deinococcus peraridilitoris (strain DSM 19664 / LMG 22246 / CIP 109416 / KR-200) TaxID=937777 RepID=L0A3L5_DEIPD|nr:metallophosphoesterase [Deinococcus peraridilitoris]AFZ68029.1 putative phosphohydrolase [Deinococcus peraridilitoris DSM 19664]